MAYGYLKDIQEKVRGKYQPGEDREAFRERMFQQITQPVDVNKITGPKAEFLKDYIIPENERAQRRLESDQARRQLIETEMAMECRDTARIKDRMGRAYAAVCYYYEQTNQPEMIERYEALFKERESDAVRMQALQEQGLSQQQAADRIKAENEQLTYERGHFITEMMQPFNSPEYAPERLMSMTTEEAQARLPEMVFLHAICMNVEPYLKKGGDTVVAFSDEDYEKSLFMKRAYAPSAYALSSVYAKANPYYEVLDTNRMLDEMTNEGALQWAMFGSDQTNLGNLATNMMSETMNRHVCAHDLITNKLADSGFDLKQPLTSVTPEGKPIVLTGEMASDYYTYLKQGGPVIVEQGEKLMMLSVQNTDGQIKVNDMSAEPLPHLAEEAVFNHSYGKELTDISAAMKKADPWYIHSSDQFRTMKQQFEELKTLGSSLSDNPEARAKQAELLDSLKKSSEAYLGYKGTEGKNDTEKKRIAVAQQILNMAKEKLNILEQPERAAQVRAVKEAQAIQTEAPNTERFEQKGMAFANLPTLPNTPHMEQINGALEMLISDLSHDVRDKLDMNALNQPIDREIGSTEENALAYMTVKALILNDQAGRTAEKPGLVTNVIKALPKIDSFVTTVRALPSYQDKLNNMTKKDLYDLVVQGGIKDLAKQVREDIAAMGGRQKAAEQDAPQMQQQEPRREQQGPQM